MNAAIEQSWKQHFVAYEDALASFYSLQDATQTTVEQSHAILRLRDELASTHQSVVEARRALRLSGNGSRVAEIDRERASIELDGVRLQVMDLAANRAAPDDTLLELSFRTNPRSLPRFVNLTAPVRIRFPFGESTFVAACRLVRFRLVRDEFAFRFATVDPV